MPSIRDRFALQKEIIRAQTDPDAARGAATLEMLGGASGSRGGYGPAKEAADVLDNVARNEASGIRAADKLARQQETQDRKVRNTTIETNARLDGRKTYTDDQGYVQHADTDEAWAKKQEADKTKKTATRALDVYDLGVKATKDALEGVNRQYEIQGKEATLDYNKKNDELIAANRDAAAAARELKADQFNAEKKRIAAEKRAHALGLQSAADEARKKQREADTTSLEWSKSKVDSAAKVDEATARATAAKDAVKAGETPPQWLQEQSQAIQGMGERDLTDEELQAQLTSHAAKGEDLSARTATPPQTLAEQITLQREADDFNKETARLQDQQQKAQTRLEQSNRSMELAPGPAGADTPDWENVVADDAQQQQSLEFHHKELLDKPDEWTKAYEARTQQDAAIAQDIETRKQALSASSQQLNQNVQQLKSASDYAINNGDTSTIMFDAGDGQGPQLWNRRNAALAREAFQKTKELEATQAPQRAKLDEDISLLNSRAATLQQQAREFNDLQEKKKQAAMDTMRAERPELAKIHDDTDAETSQLVAAATAGMQPGSEPAKVAEAKVREEQAKKLDERVGAHQKAKADVMGMADLGNEIRQAEKDKNVDPENAYALAAELRAKVKASGFTEADVIDESHKAGFEGKYENAPSVTMRSGVLVVNPSLAMDDAAYDKAVADSGASEAAKQVALKQKSMLQQKIAEAEAPGWAIMFPDSAQAIPSQPAMLAEWVKARREEAKKGGFLDKALESLKGAAGRAGNVVTTLAGQGDSDAAEASRRLAEGYEYAATAEGRNKYGKMIVDSALDMAPTMGFGMVAGQGAKALAGALGASVKTATAVGSMAGAIASGIGEGVQQGVPDYYEARKNYEAQGLPPEEAKSKAKTEALLSGGLTALIGALGGNSGAETILNMGENGFKKSLLAAIKKIPGAAGEEIAEEELQTIAQYFVKAAGSQPDATLGSLLEDMRDSAIVAGVMGGTLGPAGEHLNARKEAAQQAAAPPESSPVVNDARVSASDAELAQTQQPDRWRVLRDIAQGADIAALPESDLNAIGMTLPQGKSVPVAMKAAKDAPAIVPDVHIDAEGRATILQPSLDQMEAEAPVTRSFVKNGEAERRQQIINSDRAAEQEAEAAKLAAKAKPVEAPKPVEKKATADLKTLAKQVLGEEAPKSTTAAPIQAAKPQAAPKKEARIESASIDAQAKTPELKKRAEMIKAGVRKIAPKFAAVEYRTMDGPISFDPNTNALIIDGPKMLAHFDHVVSGKSAADAIHTVLKEETKHRLSVELDKTSRTYRANLDKLEAEAPQSLIDKVSAAYFKNTKRKLPKESVRHELVARLAILSEGDVIPEEILQSPRLLQTIRDLIAEYVTELKKLLSGEIHPELKTTVDELLKEMAALDAKLEKASAQPTTKSASNSNSVVVATDAKAHEAATSPKNDLPEPTEAQSQAGNYRKGHVKIGGMDISVENPAGSTRSGTDSKGKPWSVTMKSHYGYLRGVEGADGDHLDVFIKPGTPENYNGPVFVINQKKGNGQFDESKTIIGVETENRAKAEYLRNYAKGWKGLGSVVKFDTVDAFKQWAQTYDHSKPAALKRKTFRVSPPISLAFQANPLVQHMQGRLMSRSTAQKTPSGDGNVYAKNADLWDGAPKLTHPTHNTVYGGTIRPDQMAQELFEAHLINDPSPDAMWKALESASKTAKQQAAGESSQRAEGIAAEKQGKAFTKAITSQEPGAQSLSAQELNRGDTIEVDGEKLTVETVESDEDGRAISVTLQDGTKYGRQQIDGDAVIFVQGHVPAVKTGGGFLLPEDQEAEPKEEIPVSGDKRFQIYTKEVYGNKMYLVPNVDGSVENGYGDTMHETLGEAIAQADANRAEIKRRNEQAKQTPKPEPSANPAFDSTGAADMFGSNEMPFNLTAESAEDKRRREERELDTENKRKAKDAADAAAEAEKDQGKLFEQPAPPVASKAEPAAEPAQAPKEAPAERAPLKTFEDFRTFTTDLREGNITAAQVKAAWEQFKAAEPAIRAELSKLGKDKLLSMAGISARASDKKESLVNSVYSGFESYFNPTDSLSYSPFGDAKGSKNAAMEAVVAKWTDEIIQKQAQDRKDAIADEQRARENPQTKDEWAKYVWRLGASKLTDEEKTETKTLKGRAAVSEWVNKRGESKLTPEQLATYDSIRGIDRKAEEARRESYKATVSGVQANTDAEIVETKHTKTGADLFVVKLADRVERDVYQSLNNAAKKLGGHYSSFRGAGAVPGFQFKSRAAAEQFQAITKGETVDRTEAIAEKKEAVKNAAASRLTTLADALDRRADDILNKDRKTNTHKRASEAASAEAGASKQKALATTMRNLSAAMENGDVTHLDGIRAGTHVETLEGLAAAAQKQAWDKEKMSYAETEKRKGEPPTPEQMASAEFPYPYLDRSTLLQMVEQGRKTAGAKRFAEKVAKIQLKQRHAHDTGGELRDDADIEDVRALANLLPGNRGGYQWDDIKWKFDRYDRLQTMGIKDLPTLRAALREFIQYRGQAAKVDPLKVMERALIGKNIAGFFPTPKSVINRMIDTANIKPGMRVLEPSAGKGDIADAIRAAGADVDVMEINSTLRDILEAKGYQVAANDFTDETAAPVYDAVVMNPPFEDGQDIEHVMRAYEHLKPGGTLVAVMSEGPFFRSDKKATAFRDWLDQHGESEKLEAGTFKSAEAFRQTGTNTRLVTIKKEGVLGTPPTGSDEDAAYMKAAESGDIATAQKMVDDSAKRAGYSIKAYHGTGADFDAFDLGKVGANHWQSNEGIFFAERKASADNYAKLAGGKSGARTISAFLKIENPLVRSAEDPADYYDDNNHSLTDDTYDVIKGERFNFKSDKRKHDGIIINGRTIKNSLYVVFSPSQIKSSEPVTRDASGAIIPLSERFNPENKSILYTPPADSEEEQEDAETESAVQSVTREVPWKSRYIADALERGMSREQVQAAWNELAGYSEAMSSRSSEDENAGAPTRATRMGRVSQNTGDAVEAYRPSVGVQDGREWAARALGVASNLKYGGMTPDFGKDVLRYIRGTVALPGLPLGNFSMRNNVTAILQDSPALRGALNIDVAEVNLLRQQQGTEGGRALRGMRDDLYAPLQKQLEKKNDVENQKARQLGFEPQKLSDDLKDAISGAQTEIADGMTSPEVAEAVLGDVIDDDAVADAEEREESGWWAQYKNSLTDAKDRARLEAVEARIRRINEIQAKIDEIKSKSAPLGTAPAAALPDTLEELMAALETEKKALTKDLEAISGTKKKTKGSNPLLDAQSLVKTLADGEKKKRKITKSQTQTFKDWVGGAKQDGIPSFHKLMKQFINPNGFNADAFKTALSNKFDVVPDDFLQAVTDRVQEIMDGPSAEPKPVKPPDFDAKAKRIVAASIARDADETVAAKKTDALESLVKKRLKGDITAQDFRNEATKIGIVADAAYALNAKVERDIARRAVNRTLAKEKAERKAELDKHEEQAKARLRSVEIELGARKGNDPKNIAAVRALTDSFLGKKGPPIDGARLLEELDKLNVLPATANNLLAALERAQAAKAADIAETLLEKKRDAEKAFIKRLSSKLKNAPQFSKFIRHLFMMADNGMLDSEAVRNAFSEHWNLHELTPENLKTIAEILREVLKMPDGQVKEGKLNQLNNIMARLAPNPTVWQAAVSAMRQYALSPITTNISQMTGAIRSLLPINAIRIAAAAQGNPLTRSSVAAKAYAKNVKLLFENLPTFVAGLSGVAGERSGQGYGVGAFPSDVTNYTPHSKSLTNMNFEQARSEYALANGKVKGWWHAPAYIGSRVFQSLVGTEGLVGNTDKAMNFLGLAMNHLTSTTDMNASQAWDAANKMLYGKDGEFTEEARKQAEEELGKKEISRFAKERRVEELVQDAIDKKWGGIISNQHRQLAARQSFKTDPVTPFGRGIYRFLKAATNPDLLGKGRINPIEPLFLFNKFFANAIETGWVHMPTSLAFVPFLPTESSLAAKGKKLSPAQKSIQEIFGSLENYKRQRYAEAITGTALAVGIVALLAASRDDDDPTKRGWFDITGPQPDWGKAQAITTASGGWYKPQTIYMGPLAISYAQLPELSMLLGAIGYASDHMRFSKVLSSHKDEDGEIEEDSKLKIAGMGVAEALAVPITRSTYRTFYDAIEGAYNGNYTKAAKMIGQPVGSMVAGMTLGGPLVRDAEKVLEQEMHGDQPRQSTTAAEGFKSGLPFIRAFADTGKPMYMPGGEKLNGFAYPLLPARPGSFLSFFNMASRPQQIKETNMEAAKILLDMGITREGPKEDYKGNGFVEISVGGKRFLLSDEQRQTAREAMGDELARLVKESESNLRDIYKNKGKEGVSSAVNSLNNKARKSAIEKVSEKYEASVKSQPTPEKPNEKTVIEFKAKPSPDAVPLPTADELRKRAASK